jgi:hypothetical protein
MHTHTHTHKHARVSEPAIDCADAPAVETARYDNSACSSCDARASAVECRCARARACAHQPRGLLCGQTANRLGYLLLVPVVPSAEHNLTAAVHRPAQRLDHEGALGHPPEASAADAGYARGHG